MTIRTADKCDIDILKKLEKHISTDTVVKKVNDGEILVAYEGEKLVGWLRYGLFWDSIPFMNMLYILDEYRGKSYGKALVTNWEKYMREAGYTSVLTSTAQNEYAQHFYIKQGYTSIGGFMFKNDPLELIFSKEI